VHRDAGSKSIISVKGFQRSSNNYIDDTEVEVQRRVVSGLEWGLNHRASWGAGSVDAYVNYRRGTGAWGSLRAPEEAFGEGTSRMKLWLLGATVQQSFTAGMQRLQYTGAWRAQQNKTSLTPQDRFAIGGRFTVRGFDGLSVLSAERGWLIRNDIATPITTQIQAYVGVDTGHVAGPSAEQLAGQNLTGGAVGLRGQWARVQYDVFIGKPLRKNERFKTSNSTAGFSLSMSM
jgi:hemolysin activation/secretion protein